MGEFFYHRSHECFFHVTVQPVETSLPSHLRETDIHLVSELMQPAVTAAVHAPYMRSSPSVDASATVSWAT